MRTSILLLLLVGAGACAGRAPRTTLATQTRYACGERVIEHAGDRVRTGADAMLSMGWHDAEGRHYVAWPMGTTSREALEYVIPPDHRADAIERRYDASRGTSRLDWRLVSQRSCTANGGYNDALARFATGKNLDQVAAELSLSNKHEARQLVRHALTTLQKRYYKDR